MAHSKPLVLVTGPNKRLRFGWWGTRFMLWLCGARAQYICPGSKKALPPAAAIVIGGGDDIEPEHYGALGDAGSKYDRERDALEMSLVRQALEDDVPILGICRGAQLINVVLGGSLHKDIRPLRKNTPNKNSIFPIKRLDIKNKTRLAEIMACRSTKINSLHNQAVDRVAHGVRVCARDADGFVQAIENHGTHHFILGVQWHPEYMPYARVQRRLFHALVAATQASSKEIELPQLES